MPFAVRFLFPFRYHNYNIAILKKQVNIRALFSHTVGMNKFLKFVPCLLVSASVLVSACACTGDGDASRSRKITEPEIQQAEPLDPNFSVDPAEKPDVIPEEPGCPECPEKPGCPECPEKTESNENGHQAPKRKWHHHCKHKKRRPMPLPHLPKRAH